jgi:hypothetical protein
MPLKILATAKWVEDPESKSQSRDLNAEFMANHVPPASPNLLERCSLPLTGSLRA